MHKTNLNSVTSRPLYICQNVMEGYAHWIFPCITKSPKVLVDRVFAKEWWGREGLSIFQTPSPQPLLSSLPITNKSFQKGDKWKKGGAGRRQENRSWEAGAFFHWPGTKRLSPSPELSPFYTRKSQHLWRAHNIGKNLASHIIRQKMYLTSSIFKKILI